MFQFPPTRNKEAIRLFCLPHAGAGPSAYRGWVPKLAPEIEGLVVPLPGREARYSQSPYVDLDHLVRDLADAVLASVEPGQRYALFGNSFGALVAFETVHEIRRRSGPAPLHLFVSATGAPHMTPILPPFGDLEDLALAREVARRYGGIPGPVLEDEEFLAAVVRVLRADIKMLESYVRTEPQPLSCPVTAFGGSHDQTVPLAHLEGWGAHTTAEFRRILLNEDHLYLQSAREELIRHIREALVPHPVVARGGETL